MKRDDRTRAMDALKHDPGCEVLLVSLKAGGVGLNLTAAQRVYLMDPYWYVLSVQAPGSPSSCSHQEPGRGEPGCGSYRKFRPLFRSGTPLSYRPQHRLGQTRPVTTVKLIIENSIEARLLEVQKKKTELANLTLGPPLSKSDIQARRMEELQQLFAS